jgi:class 3 adenylate cyclase/tetratricopeptide (TPR) repeat protein
MSPGRVETATVVFTDLVGSTAVRSAIGDERSEVLRRLHDTLTTDAVAAYDGRIVKSLGDGFMAVFSSASDAIHSATAIQRAFDRHNRQARSEPEMHVRVGIAVGDVTFEEEDYHGMPVVQAARLCGRCEADEILATMAVKWLAGSRVTSAFVDVGALELKGISQPTECVRIEWPREEVAEARSIPLQGFLEGGSSGALRGRSAEVATLSSMWAAVQEGNPQIALVSGEPGIGKTRLVTELARRVASGGGIVLAGRVEEGLGGPYQPFVEAILHYVRQPSSDGAPRPLGSGAGELTRIVPDLEQLVGPLPPPVKADTGTEQYRLADAVASFITTVSESAPVLFVIDDFHWCAPQTALLLRHLCANLAHSKVMVAVTFRDTDIPNNAPAGGVVADLFRFPEMQLLNVTGIDSVAVRELIDDGGGLDDQYDLQQLAEQIQQEADGNPFFVNELIRHVGEGPASTGSDTAHRFTAEPPTLPTSVTEVVRRRLKRLSPATVDMLSHAAIAGREFTLKLLASILGDQITLLDSAEEAIRARLLEERGVGRYRFVHRLVAETLIADLSATRRAGLHLRMATAIERENASDIEVVIGELAHHYAVAVPFGDLTHTVDVLQRAGNKAMRQLAFAEAADYFRRALELATDRDPATQIDLLIALTRAQSHAGQPDRTALLRATTLARSIGDDRRFAEAALAEDVAVLGVFGSVDTGRTAILEEAIGRSDDLPVSLQAQLHADLALELVFADTVERKLRLANRALELARQSHSNETLARVLALRYPTLWTARTLDDRLKIVEELIALSDQLDDSSLAFLAAANGALVMLEAGDVHEADRRLVTAEHLAQRLGEPRLRWFAAICRAKRQIIVGDLDGAEITADQASQLGGSAGRADAPNYLAAQRFCIGFHRGALDGLQSAVDQAVERSRGAPSFRSMRVALRSEVGDVVGARRELSELAATGFAFAAEFTQVVALCFCSLGAAAVHDADAAAALYERLAPHRGRFADAGSTWYGSVDHYLGGLARVLGRDGDAREHYGEAQRLHTQVGSHPMVSRTVRDIEALGGSL